MSRVTMHTQTQQVSLPRGWIVLGLALASWFVVAATWIGISQVFALVAAVV